MAELATASGDGAAPVIVGTSEAPAACRFVFRGSRDAADRAAAVLGVSLPAKPCRSSSAGDRAALWLGPDEWLVLLPATECEHIRVAGAAALEGVAHALVDVSARQRGLIVRGPAAQDVLSAGCPLDLDPQAFPVGMCTRTLFGKAEVIMWRTDADVFRLEVARSFADYVTGLLAAASADETACRNLRAAS